MLWNAYIIRFIKMREFVSNIRTLVIPRTIESLIGKLLLTLGTSPKYNTFKPYYTLLITLSIKGFLIGSASCLQSHF